MSAANLQPSNDPAERVPMQPREILRLLETTPLLGEMSTRERAVLAEVAEVVRCARDVELFGVGQEVRWWYLILNGRVAEAVRAPDGTWQSVRDAAAGECIGLDAVISGQPATVQATCVAACSFVRINAPNFNALLRGPGPASVKFQLAMQEALGTDLRAALTEMVRLAV